MLCPDDALSCINVFMYRTHVYVMRSRLPRVKTAEILQGIFLQ
jgi:hypothetical protein